MITMIACLDSENGIGKGNGLLTHLPKDLEHFKKTTVGKVCVFGRTTYDSLPVKPLPQRANIVLTTDKSMLNHGCIVMRSMEEILELAEDYHIYICGGQTVYEQFMPYADELIISQMEEAFNADTFFPYIEEDEWIPYSCEGVEDKLNFEIIKYKRKEKGE